MTRRRFRNGGLGGILAGSGVEGAVEVLVGGGVGQGLFQVEEFFVAGGVFAVVFCVAVVAGDICFDAGVVQGGFQVVHGGEAFQFQLVEGALELGQLFFGVVALGLGLWVFAHEADDPLDDVYGPAEQHFQGAPTATVPGVEGGVHEGRRIPGFGGSGRGQLRGRNVFGSAPFCLVVPGVWGSVWGRLEVPVFYRGAPFCLVVPGVWDSGPGCLVGQGFPGGPGPALLQLLPRFVEADGEAVFLEQGVGEGADFDDPCGVQAELALAVG